MFVFAGVKWMDYGASGRCQMDGAVAKDFKAIIDEGEAAASR